MVSDIIKKGNKMNLKIGSFLQLADNQSFLRFRRNMNYPLNRQSFNILTKSENPVSRIIPKSNFYDFQSFALFQ